MAIEIPQDDPERQEFTEEHKVELSNRLKILVPHVCKVARQGYAFDLNLLCAWHRYLFFEIRDHAGKIRSNDYGTPVLVFGPHASVHRDNVPARLETYFRDANFIGNQLRQIEEKSAIEGAVRIHADLIKIHPFEDGNGRVGRLNINYWLRSLNFPALIALSPKREYINALNHYYDTGQIEPLVMWAIDMLGRSNELSESNQ